MYVFMYEVCSGVSLNHSMHVYVPISVCHVSVVLTVVEDCIGPCGAIVRVGCELPHMGAGN